ncbi:MAG: DUF2164 domain-containing protein [bacterium]|nr:DUF2164 domain-containing protein [bacterium]
MNLTKHNRDEIIEKLQAYFAKELETELGPFDAGFLLDFIAEKLGPYFYNRGLFDAQAVLSKKMEEVENAILEIEKPIR